MAPKRSGGGGGKRAAALRRSPHLLLVEERDLSAGGADGADEERTVRAAQRQTVMHTRRCNGREICNCVLRSESVQFREALKPQRSVRLRVKGTAVVRSLAHFDREALGLILRFLTPAELAILSMVSKALRKEVDAIAERDITAFVAERAAHETIKILKREKHDTQTWSRYMHLQKTCVHKLFVHYTGYRTGAMRTATPYWAFGEVDVDPNDPSHAILPNSWTFREHKPWLQQKSNGKDGKWKLREPYKHGRAPKSFVEAVNDWSAKIRPGECLAVAFRAEGLDETWWEAQVWYVWRADGRLDPAEVFDAQANRIIEVPPQNLMKHFQENPLHVIDVCSTPRSSCSLCTKAGRSFHECHIVRGHPML